MNAITLTSGTHSPILLVVSFVPYWIVSTTVEVDMKKPEDKKRLLHELKEEFEAELADTDADVDAIIDKLEADFEKEFGYALRQQT